MSVPICACPFARGSGAGLLVGPVPAPEASGPASSACLVASWSAELSCSACKKQACHMLPRDSVQA